MDRIETPVDSRTLLRIAARLREETHGHDSNMADAGSMFYAAMSAIASAIEDELRIEVIGSFEELSSQGERIR